MKYPLPDGVFDVIHEKLQIQEDQNADITIEKRREFFNQDIDIYVLSLDILPSYATYQSNVRTRRYKEAVTFDVTFRREDLGKPAETCSQRIERPSEIFGELVERYIQNHWSQEDFLPTLCIKATACAFRKDGKEVRLRNPVLGEWEMSYSKAMEQFFLVDLYGKMPTLADIFGKEAAVYDDPTDE